MKKIIAAASAMFVGLLLFAPSARANNLPVGRPATICDHHDHAPVQAGRGAPVYYVRNTYWLGYGSLCVQSSGKPSYVVTKTPLPTSYYNRVRHQHKAMLVTSYPAVYQGCIWNMCTPDMKLPARVDRVKSVRTDWHTVSRASGTWNTALDLWFGKHRMTQGHADGAELMVWLTEGGRCCSMASRNPPVSKLGGKRFWVQHWVPHDHGVTWNYIQFRMIHRVQSVKNLELKPFIDYAVKKGWIKRGWWLENVNAGFEIWDGGVGLRTTNFKLHVITR